MTKKYFIILLLSLLSIFVSGQNFKLGFQASPQFSWMKSSNININNEQSRFGVDYGLVADLFLAGYPRYLLNTGILVSHQAFSSHFDQDEPFFVNLYTFNEPVNINFRLNYLQIPLNIKLKSDQFYRFTFFGQFGVSNYFNLSATSYSSDSQLNGDNINSAISLYYVGMIMGAGAEYDLGRNTALCVGVQYSNGLSDITKMKNLREKGVLNSAKLMIGVMF